MTNIFSHNVGAADRTFRIILGVVLLALVFTGPRTPWGWLGLIPLLSAAAGVCPLYGMLHVSTRKKA